MIVDSKIAKIYLNYVFLFVRFFFHQADFSFTTDLHGEEHGEGHGE